VTAFRFIPPCSPIRAKEVPAGDDWLHEVKFDGYRVQVHNVGSRVIIYSRNGHDFTERFPSIAQLLHELPAKAAVLDGEVVASDADGRPNFARLQTRRYPPVGIRLACIQRPRSSAPAAGEAPGVPAGPVGALRLSLSEPFANGLALLRVAEQRSLEGIVSKRRDAPYRSGECRDWRKVKTVAWREANRERWRLFERG